MTDFIRNLVLRGSGLVPPLEVRPTHRSQFPPALMADRQYLPSLQAPVRAVSTSPRQDAVAPVPNNFQQPNEVEPNVEVTRSSPTSNGFPSQSSYSSMRHREPGQPLPAPAPSLASPETYPEPTSQMESASNKVDRPHSENKLAESGLAPDQIELHACSTLEPASPMVALPGTPSLSSRDIEQSEVEPVLRPTPVTQSAGLEHRHFEDQHLEAEQSLDKTEPSTHQESPSSSPAAPLNIHNSALPIGEPILLTPRPIPVTPGLDSSWTYPVIRPPLPGAPDHAVSSPSTVEVHIGTLEVRANQPLPASPPPLATKPQGFQDYAHMRGWDGE